MLEAGRTRTVAWLERHALTTAAVVTTVFVAVLFYYPVATVLVESVLVDGTPSFAAFVDILQSTFYVGVFARLFQLPVDVVALTAGFADWISSGFPQFRLGLFGFTAYQALLSTVASVALGLPAAYVLARFDFRGRDTLRSLTILPFVLPSIMVAIGFAAMFGERGTLNAVFAVFGLESVSLMFTLELIVLAHAFYNAPLVARVTTAAWEQVDVRMVETARTLGASRQRAFLDVVLPQLLPAVLTGALLTFIFTFMSFPIVLALGGLQLATVEVWIFARIRQLAYAEAAALAVIEGAISIALTYAYLRYEALQVRSNRSAQSPPRTPLVPSRRRLQSLSPRTLLGVAGVRVGVAAYAIVAIIVFVGPIASMVVTSLTGPNGVTLQHYAFLLEREATGAAFQTKPLVAIRNSLAFGVGALALALPMGVTVAVLSTTENRYAAVVDTLAMAPLAVSGVVVGLGLLRGLVFGVDIFEIQIQVTGALAVVAAHAVGAYPFVTRNVAPMLAGLDQSFTESARTLGATRTRALLDIELPLVASGLAAGAAFAFAISIGEFNSTVILATGSDSYTMPVAVQRYLGDRTLGPATAMGTVLLAVTAASFVVIDRVGGRWQRG